MAKKKQKERFGKIINHPSAKLIVRELNKGTGVRALEKMLIELYPGNKEYHLTYATLHKFRKEHLDIEGEALKVIKEVEKDNQEKKEIQKEHARVKKISTYKDKLKKHLANI